MFYIFPFFLASHSLLNFGSIYPIWLFLCIFNLIYLTLKNHKITFYSFQLFLPFIAFLSFLINSNQSKLGHLIAYFVIFILVVTSLVHYFLFKCKDKEGCLIKLKSFLFIVCNTLFITATADYVLLVNNIDYSDFIPADLNSPIMNSFSSRARAFWNEPTDLCLAANTFFSLYLAITIFLKNYFSNWKNSFFNKELFILIQWLTILCISRSAAAIGALIISTFFIFILEFLFKKKTFFVKKSSLINLFFTIPTTIIFLFIFRNSFIDYFQGVIVKLTFNQDAISVSDRLSGWLYLLEKFNSSNLIQLLFGYGPGHTSLSSQLYGTKGALSWILTLPLDLGIIGLFSFLFIILKILINLKYIPKTIRPFYLVALISTLVHLCTQTGFYLPSLAFVMSIPIVFYKLEKNKNIAI